MIHFLIDEDMPRSKLPAALRDVGLECSDVRDVGLRAAADQTIFEWAQENKCIILTEDLGFSNTLRFPLGSHNGIIVGRFPSTTTPETINEILIKTILDIKEDLPDNLTIIEPKKIRIRRKQP